MKDTGERSLRGLKWSLKIWRATENRTGERGCPICKKTIKKSTPCKVVVGKTKEYTRFYHLRCYIDGLRKEVANYEAIERLFKSEGK